MANSKTVGATVPWGVTRTALNPPVVVELTLSGPTDEVPPAALPTSSSAPPPFSKTTAVVERRLPTATAVSSRRSVPPETLSEVPTLVTALVGPASTSVEPLEATKFRLAEFGPAPASSGPLTVVVCGPRVTRPSEPVPPSVRVPAPVKFQPPKFEFRPAKTESAAADPESVGLVTATPVAEPPRRNSAESRPVGTPAGLQLAAPCHAVPVLFQVNDCAPTRGAASASVARGKAVSRRSWRVGNRIPTR